jgi:hypothetical protein
MCGFDAHPKPLNIKRVTDSVCNPFAAATLLDLLQWFPLKNGWRALNAPGCSPKQNAAMKLADKIATQWPGIDGRMVRNLKREIIPCYKRCDSLFTPR